VELYHLARIPQPEPVMPFDAGVKEKIETLYARAVSYFKE
jgi:hypothetical protein